MLSEIGVRSMRQPPIFIVGCPRSGTTLVSELLEGSSWGSPVETHFIPKYFRRLGRYGSLDDRARFTKLVRAILRERPVMQWRLDIDPDHLYRIIETRDYRTIVDTICRLRFERLGKSSWGDKTPHYVFDLDVLASALPSARNSST